MRQRLRRPNPEGAPFLHPRRALVAQQCAANFSGIIARWGADDLEALGVLVAAEPVFQEVRHAVGDGLAVRVRLRFDDGMHALANSGSGNPTTTQERTPGHSDTAASTSAG